ncbi:hypothetical protein VHA01S_004_01040 [Vibrio halioticoli NBRC 102217]|uniref:Metallopeptidase DUF4344 n=1 Tax=Vibrio halioticoli NBRC 102217 TaxID=1219072 RepID=V5FEN9_9VIBR|nr:DUF4344 domain-containing metallopeptidase [Vibrio halioticoli]GAD88331.1 hypothetical protein VHA01S_004_01040 [Vibrio halioticoli NBRC 102217]
MLRIALVGLLVIASSVLASEMVDLKYQSPKGKDEQAVYQMIVESGINQQFSALVEEVLPFNNAMTLVYGGDEGPLYDPSIHTLFIPYSFILEAQHYFSQNRPADEVNQGVLDTLMHTLLHEAGHALVADVEIPILGREEDAVDNLATIIMLEYLEDGAQVAINAADMFSYESEEGSEYYDFGEYVGDHSFDLQRYFATLCLVYGSDPKAHADLLNEVEGDYLAEQKEMCEENYQNLSFNWHQYLKEENEQ